MARRVASANHMLATWTPGPVPADFDALRRQWEFGRLTIAGVKLIGFTLLGWRACGRRTHAFAPMSVEFDSSVDLRKRELDRKGWDVNA